MNKKWLTVEDACVYLNRSKNAIYHLVSKGIIKKRKFAGRLYFKESELDALIDLGIEG